MNDVPVDLLVDLLSRHRSGTAVVRAELALELQAMGYPPDAETLSPVDAVWLLEELETGITHAPLRTVPDRDGHFEILRLTVAPPRPRDPSTGSTWPNP